MRTTNRFSVVAGHMGQEHGFDMWPEHDTGHLDHVKAHRKVNMVKGDLVCTRRMSRWRTQTAKQ